VKRVRKGRRAILVLAGLAMAAAVIVLPHQALSHETVTTTVMFDREIVQILDRHCVMCHVERGLSFPLETYEQTWLARRKIRSEVIARHMPPWAALPGYGEFVNDNSLTLRETQFVVSWVEGLGPRNAGRVFTNTASGGAAPEPVRARGHAHAGHWQLGAPDVMTHLPASTIAAHEADTVRRFVLDPGLTAERYVRALEFMPGDARVVRAAFFIVEDTGQWLGSWSPWYGHVEAPPGTAYRLPAGTRLIAEVHYRGADEEVVDHSMLGITFAGAPTGRILSDAVLEAGGELAAGATAHRLRADTRLDAETHAWALWPAATDGVKSIEVSARTPDGGTSVLLFARDVPRAWPTSYIFKEPVSLPVGTTVSVTAYFENPSTTRQPAHVRVAMSRY
jgi:hypothetical protein